MPDDHFIPLSEILCSGMVTEGPLYPTLLTGRTDEMSCACLHAHSGHDPPVKPVWDVKNAIDIPVTALCTPVTVLSGFDPMRTRPDPIARAVHAALDLFLC